MGARAQRVEAFPGFERLKRPLSTKLTAPSGWQPRKHEFQYRRLGSTRGRGIRAFLENTMIL